MKRILLFTLFGVAAVSFLRAQSKGNTKVFAYKQSVIPGRAPGGILNEGGQELQTNKKASETYQIYTSSALRIYPTEVWIKGKQYRVSSELINTPVHLNPKKILVPKTSNKVLRLTPKEGTPEKHFIKGSQLAAQNEVVIIYSLKGKYYYTVVKKFTALPADVLQ